MVDIQNYLLLFAVFALRLGGINGSESEKRLVRYLFNESNHDISVRPVVNSSDSLNVILRLALYQLVEIDEKHQEITLSVWLTTEWTDYQMKWDPAEYDGIKTINTHPDRLWLPDIVLYNNANEDNSEYGGNMDTLKTRIKVHHTGKLFWIAPLIIRAKCKIQVEDFPFDTQKCLLKFGSWTYDLARMNLSSGGIDTSTYMPNVEWNLKKVEALSQQVKYECCPEIYPDVTFVIYFERKSLFYVTNLIFPMALIALLTIMTFILPQESGERIGLSVTLMLAVTVFMLVVAETTPDSSEALPVVAHYFIFCLVLMFLIIVILCYISRMYNRGRTDRPMGTWTRRWILNHLSYVLFIRYPRKKKGKPGSIEQQKTAIDNKIADHSEGKCNENQKTGAILQRLSRSPSLTSEDIKQLELIMKRLVEVDEKDRRDDDQEDEVCTVDEEWRVVAMTIDRILFLAFMAIFIVGTIAIFANTKYVGRGATIEHQSKRSEFTRNKLR